MSYLEDTKMSTMSIHFNRLKYYIKDHQKKYPKLAPALKALSEFIGHDDIKETVAKMVLFFISQCKITELRRSKRKTTRHRKKRRRTSSVSTSDDEDEEYKPEEDDHAKMALIALLTHSLQQQEDSSDDEYEEEDPPHKERERSRS